jgi:hypothetical protein
MTEEFCSALPRTGCPARHGMEERPSASHEFRTLNAKHPSRNLPALCQELPHKGHGLSPLGVGHRV